MSATHPIEDALTKVIEENQDNRLLADLAILAKRVNGFVVIGGLPDSGSAAYWAQTFGYDLDAVARSFDFASPLDADLLAEQRARAGG